MDPDAIKRNLILRLSIDFSIQVIEYSEKLNEMRKYVIARQLLRAATSIGANAMEAQQAESKADFVHKMKIAAKEATETQYWLILCSEAASYPSALDLLSQVAEISRVLNKIIASSKHRS